MTLELTVVDAFTDKPFHGNSAAVAVIDSFPEDARLQLIAREMNLAETSFVVRRNDGEYDLRWFTPMVEVDLCGHATLAAAHVLGGNSQFHTRSGRLECFSGLDGWIEMDFPADFPLPAERPPIFDSKDTEWYGLGRSDALVELHNAAIVRTFQPDLAGLADLGTRLVIITAAGDRTGIDCVSRVFGPNVGIHEDPVTGSAHCTLSGYWSQKLGKESLVGEQASARGGVVRMRQRGDRVMISGQAVTTAEVRLVV